MNMGRIKVGYNSEHVLEDTKGEDLVKSLIKDKRLGKEIMDESSKTPTCA